MSIRFFVIAALMFGFAYNITTTQAEETSFTVTLRANYDFNILGDTVLNPGPDSGYIPFTAVGDYTFTLDPSLNDPSEPTTVPFVNVTGKLQGTSPAAFLPHFITPEVQFVGGALTEIVRDTNGEVISANVTNLEMQWEMVGEAGSPIAGLHLVTGGSSLDPTSNIPFDGSISSIPFALGNIIQGPDFDDANVFEAFEVFLGTDLVVLGANRTLTVVPEPTSIVLISLVWVGLCGSRLGLLCKFQKQPMKPTRATC